MHAGYRGRGGPAVGSFGRRLDGRFKRRVPERNP